MSSVSLLLAKEREDPDEVKAYVARFAAAPSTDEAADCSTMEASPVELGKAPPCEAYASLRPFKALEESVSQYHKCTQPAHVKERVLDVLSFGTFAAFICGNTKLNEYVKIFQGTAGES